MASPLRSTALALAVAAAIAADGCGSSKPSYCSSLSNLKKQAASSPTPATLAQIPSQVSAVSTAVKNFSNATSSKCS